jgi:predicted AAA+ superfamily ATPase
VVGKKVFEVNEKYFFEDMGIRNAIVPYQQKDLGKILENTVYLHLRICGFDVTVGKLGDREIDFVASRRGETQYFQVAYLIADQKTHEREFGNLAAIKDNYPKTVLSMDEFEGNSFQGINQLNIRTFLSKPL